ncbi:MAG: hypothetical protein JJE22_19280 [Bacteroidia bacterium]|nr:hypothetical protein [Bacteroidia bacterium]
MKHTILLLALTVIIFSSCTTAYKTGQTPDDVYFSPAAPEQDEYVQTQNDDRRYQSDEEYYDDRFLRMKVHNRAQWSNLDDWYYFGNRYNYSYYNNFNTPWSPYSYWNYYYNPYSGYSPYGGGIYIINNSKSAVVYNRPRTFNLNTYNGNLLNNNSYTVPRGEKTSRSSQYLYVQPRNSYNSRSSNRNDGSSLRNIFNNNNNSRSSSNSNNSNNSTNSSSSSSSSGSSGGSAPVRRF